MKNTWHEAERWLNQGRNDLEFVEWLYQEQRFFDKGCFLAQQSAEKLLKACLYATGQRKVFGHSLFEFAQKLQDFDAMFSDILDACRRLDRYYISARYPNGLPGGPPFQMYTQEDLNEAWEDLNAIHRTVSGWINAEEPSGTE